VQRSGPRAAPPTFLSIEPDWSDLAGSSSLPLTEEELRNIRGLGDLLDLQEVSEVYLPVSELLSIYVKQAQLLHGNTVEFFGERAARNTVYHRRGRLGCRG
jgi:type I pantothenate kinase